MLFDTSHPTPPAEKLLPLPHHRGVALLWGATLRFWNQWEAQGFPPAALTPHWRRELGRLGLLPRRLPW